MLTVTSTQVTWGRASAEADVALHGTTLPSGFHPVQHSAPAHHPAQHGAAGHHHPAQHAAAGGHHHASHAASGHHASHGAHSSGGHHASHGGHGGNSYSAPPAPAYGAPTATDHKEGICTDVRWQQHWSCCFTFSSVMWSPLITFLGRFAAVPRWSWIINISSILTVIQLIY